MASVLIVDDDPKVARVLCAALANAGYAVVHAANGRVALACMAEQRFDAIVSDIIMPELDGIALLRRLRDAGDLTPVLLISRAGVPSPPLPATYILPKPIDLNELVAEVRAAITAS